MDLHLVQTDHCKNCSLLLLSEELLHVSCHSQHVETYPAPTKKVTLTVL